MLIDVKSILLYVKLKVRMEKDIYMKDASLSLREVVCVLLLVLSIALSIQNMARNF